MVDAWWTDCYMVGIWTALLSLPLWQPVWTHASCCSFADSWAKQVDSTSYLSVCLCTPQWPSAPSATVLNDGVPDIVDMLCSLPDMQLSETGLRRLSI